MNSKSFDCLSCGLKIVSSIFSGVNGLCVICAHLHRQLPRKHDEPLMVIVKDQEMYRLDSNICFLVPAAELLAALDLLRVWKSDDHPQYFEIESQKALLRFAIRKEREFLTLNDDHWRRTSCEAVSLFEQGCGYILTAKCRLSFSDIQKEEWSEGGTVLACGGFSYISDREVIYRRYTWRS